MEYGPEGQTHPHVCPVKGGSPEHGEMLRKMYDGEREGTTPDGRAFKVIPPFQPDAPNYPQLDTHLWSAFAVLAVETGGYHDIEARDPYTGRKLWTRLSDGDHNVYSQLRQLVDAMEAADFFPAESTD